MPDIVMSVIGDCHLGAYRRNKWYYDKCHNAFKTIIDNIGSNRLVVAGDLWDMDAPKPYDLVFVQEVIDKPTTTIIPGNHDRIPMDGACAANVLNKAFVYMEPTVEDLGNGLVIHYVPFDVEMAERLKQHTDNYNFNDGKKHILISHFSFIEVVSYVENSARGLSESDPVFIPYDQVIVSDSHVIYDHGKFHTTGPTYMFTIDEMYSKNAIPSYVNIMSDGSVERVRFDSWKPQIINSDVEAIDDDQLYLIVTSESVPTTKPNVFVKFKNKNKNGNDDVISLEIDESISLSGGVNKDRFFAAVYPNMASKDLKKLIDYEAGLIEVDDLVAEGETAKKDDGSKDEAVLSGLVDDDFSF